MKQTNFVFHAFPGKEDPVLAEGLSLMTPAIRGESRYVRSYLEREEALPLSPVDLTASGKHPLEPHEDDPHGMIGLTGDRLRVIAFFSRVDPCVDCRKKMVVK